MKELDGQKEAAQWKIIETHSTKSLSVKKKVLSATIIHIQRTNILSRSYQTIPPKNTHTHTQKKKNHTLCKKRLNYGFFLKKKIYSD